MGHAVGRALRTHGHRVITALGGRSDRSRQLAELAGIEDTDDLVTLVRESDIVLSILPPAAAAEFASATAGAMTAAQDTPVFVDCNAVSPNTVTAIAQTIQDSGAPFVDVGILGGAPSETSVPRFYASGPDVQRVSGLDGKGIEVMEMGGKIGDASAIKMCYAALTKGTWALHTAVLIAAKRLGLATSLIAEFEHSQQSTLERMRTGVPWLATDAGRWIGEMEEIAATFASAGAPTGFHDGAAAIFRLLATTSLAEETREHQDRSRTLDQAIDIFADALTHRSAAE
jgi:3-hydroxyisobutyrate dehydrogenase-like beta-hydroxyacid dehydrogenase